MLVPVLAGLVLGGVAGCGGPEGLDRSRYQSVFEAAMQSVHDADLNALWPLLTEHGRDQVTKKMRTWQAMLRDPEKRERIRSLAEEHLGDVSNEELDRVGRAPLAEAWSFFLKADPRPARPTQRSFRASKDGRTVLIEYEDPRGTLAGIELVQRADGWYVNDLGL